MNDLDAFEILDLLDSLVERSLVICDPVTGRYHMSESMRVYAEQQLGAELDQMRAAHFKYYAELAERMFAHNRNQEDAKALAMFLPEIDNFRHAYEWSIVHDAKRCLHLICCISPSWFRHARREAEPLALKALQTAPEAADRDHISMRAQIARGKLRQGSTSEARALLEVALRQLDEAPEEPLLRVFVTGTVGVLEVHSGNYDLARERVTEALELSIEHGLVPFQASAYINLGEICRAAGDLQAARAYYEDGLRLSTGDAFSDSLVLFNLGSTALELQDVEKAEDCFRRGLAIDATVDIAHANANLGALGYICVLKGRYREAGLLMGYPEARRQKQNNRMDPVDLRLYEHYRKLGTERGGKEFENGFADGAHLNAEQLLKIIDETTPASVREDDHDC